VSEARWQGFLRAQRANVLQLAGRSAEATALATGLLETPGVDDVAKLRALDPVVLPLALSGQTSEAVAAAEALIETALRLRDVVPRAPAWVFNVWIVSLLLAGRLREADAVADRMDALRAEGVAVEVAPRSLMGWRSRIALFRGRPVTAARYSREVVAELRDQAAASRWRCWALALLAEAHAASGDVVGAAEAARACAAEEQALAPAPLSLLGGDVARALAWVPAARGELSVARNVAIDAAAGSRAAGEFAVEVFALHEALRLGARGGVVTRLAELSQVVDGEWSRACSEHAAALVADDGIALDRAASAFEDIGAIRMGAEAAAEAAGAYRRRGLDARAAASATRSAVLQAGCEGTRVPRLQLEESGLGSLSRREQEVAGLAVAGLSNPEIAHRLVVSRRTVEGHLYRLYAKLGVSDRDALARLLAPPGQDG
jgi:DNA-binding NarL/FixJ family response regulator